MRSTVLSVLLLSLCVSMTAVLVLTCIAVAIAIGFSVFDAYRLPVLSYSLDSSLTVPIELCLLT